MTSHMKPGLIPIALLFVFSSAVGQTPTLNQNSSRSNNNNTRAYNQNNARSNHAKMMSGGLDFQLTPQYGINMKGGKIDSLLFRGNGPGFKMDAGYSFRNFGIGFSSGFVSSQMDKTKINEFLLRNGVPFDQMIINTGSQQNMYVLLGPNASFGNRIRADLHAKGGLFVNNSGFVNIKRQGAINSIYRNEPSAKTIYPGFITGINLNYHLSDLLTIGFGTDYLNTKSEVINYDIRRGAAIEGIKLTKNISNVMAGISIRYNVKSSRDMSTGVATGKQLGKPKYEDINATDAQNGSSTEKATAQFNPKEYSLDKSYRPGRPVFGNRESSQSCGPVTIKKTFGDGSTEEMTFTCPDDAVAYERQTPKRDFGERNFAGDDPGDYKRTFATPHVLEQKGTISGRVSWTTASNTTGIVTNKTIRGGGIRFNENQGAARTTPSSSFGTMVRLSARDAGSGMATGKRQFEPVFTEGQGEVCNPCMVTVSNPVYKGGMGNAQSNPMYIDKNNQGANPMYEDKARISAPDDCDDNDPGIADLKISLMDISTGQVVATTKTEKCGDFFFANVPNGDYKIQLSGVISGKKGYDFYMKTKTEMDGQIVWGGESVDLTLYPNEELSTPSMRAGISTSRSNIRTKSITIIDADSDGDGTFDSFRALASFSDGSTADITEDAAASRVNKIDAFTIKQKAFNKMHRLTRGKASSSLQLTGITVSNGGNNNFSANATFSDGSTFDITNAVAVNSSSPTIRQYTVVAGDLDDDGSADAVLKITKSRSNIQNNRMADGSTGNNGNATEGIKITKSRSNTQNNRLIKGDEEEDQELGVVKTKTKSNQSNDRLAADDEIWSPRSNILSFAIVAGDLDGDGKAEAAINTSHSNIKNNRISVADIDGDGVAEATVNTSRSNIKHLSVAVGDVDGDGYTEMLLGGMVPGGAVISAAMRSPGDPIPGLDVKLKKKSGGAEKNITTEANGMIRVIGPDMEPDTYEMSINVNFYIEDETLVIVGEDAGSEKREVKVSASQNSQTLKTADPNSMPVKWTAPESMKIAINTSHSNIKNLLASVDELELMLNTDNSNAKTAINNSHSNIKNLRTAAIILGNTMDDIEGKEKTVAMSDVKNKMAAMNMQFLALQESLNNAGKQYTTISNVLKTKHDTVKNSIGNIR